MDELKIFEDLGGKGKTKKIILPLTEEAEEPVLIQIEDVEAAED